MKYRGVYIYIYRERERRREREIERKCVWFSGRGSCIFSDLKSCKDIGTISTSNLSRLHTTNVNRSNERTKKNKKQKKKKQTKKKQEADDIPHNLLLMQTTHMISHFLQNTHVQAESRLHSLEQAARSIGFNVK